MDRPGVGSVGVRAACAADASAIALVHWQSWRETYAGLVPEERLGVEALERRHTQWGRRLAAPRPQGERILVGLVDGEVVGWASGGPGVRGDRPVAHLAGGRAGAGREATTPASWELQGLYVLRVHHGSGVAQELLDAAVPDGPAFLWVARDNPRAQAFYRRNGFALDGMSVVEQRLGGLVAVRMVRSVGARS